MRIETSGEYACESSVRRRWRTNEITQGEATDGACGGVACDVLSGSSLTSGQMLIRGWRECGYRYRRDARVQYVRHDRGGRHRRVRRGRLTVDRQCER